MHIILGGTGHVGSAVATALLERREPVTIVTRDPAKGERWRARGAEVAVADIGDPDALRDVLRRGRRAFLLNPPAHPSTDTDAEEGRTVAAIVAALDGSGLEAVVAQSTYGAQPGRRCGDLNVLFAFEEALRAQPIPAGIVRAAYYMSNWDALLAPARDDGILPTLYPEDLRIPMVAPADLGRVAARLMTGPAGPTGLHHVEGPERYSSADVAAAFAAALGRPVRVAVTPRAGWKKAFLALGYSDTAAESYAGMTAVSVDGAYDLPAAPLRGTVSLRRHVSDLVGRATGRAAPPGDAAA